MRMVPVLGKVVTELEEHLHIISYELSSRGPLRPREKLKRLFLCYRDANGHQTWPLDDIQ